MDIKSPKYQEMEDIAHPLAPTDIMGGGAFFLANVAHQHFIFCEKLMVRVRDGISSKYRGDVNPTFFLFVPLDPETRGLTGVTGLMKITNRGSKGHACGSN